MRILLVEDDQSLARGLAKVLRHNGYTVDHEATGEGALALARGEAYSAVLLDVGLPDQSGFSVLKEIRRTSKVPIMLLTARDAVPDRVRGLDLGADDYVLKPFDMSELEARVRALVRRGMNDGMSQVSCGNLTVDLGERAAFLSGEPLNLRRREFAVLVSLVSRANRLVAKDKLANEVFGIDEPVSPNALEIYIARLRKNLENGGPKIRTVRGLGYLIEAA